MSSIEASVFASGFHSAVSNAGHRPPPPPPPVPEPSFPLSEVETPLSSPPVPTETATEPVKDLNNSRLNLLFEFQRLFDPFDYESVRNQILDRQMIRCKFTTVLWRIFLHCLPRESSQWNDILDHSRAEYEKLVREYKIDPYMMSDHNGDAKYLNHPLSQDENSLWKQYFVDEELKATITQDVRRTCPEISFFRNPRISDTLLQILFAHSRRHQHLTPYRQGMHEILAVIIYSIHSESVKINEYPESNAIMKKIYDPQYLEHDAYTMYEKIMEHLRQYYDFKTNNSVPRRIVNMNENKQAPFQRPIDSQAQTSDTVLRVNAMFERLRHYDRFLHCKLEELSIEPTVYGIRWLRLLFGREIPFGSIPSLWTVIFCFDEHFGFVDYFFVALLMEVGQLLNKQKEVGFSSCLTLLMQQNVISNAELIIRQALILSGRQLQCLPDDTRLNPVENDRENSTRSKELIRVPIAAPSQPRLNRPFIAEQTARKPIVSPPAATPNRSTVPLPRSSTSNTPFISPPAPSSRSAPPQPPVVAEMEVWPDKTTREQLEDILRIQKSCAQFMNQFLDQLQMRICDLQARNEDELLIQVTGLKQIANVLDGKLTFDSDSLQALINYRAREKTNDNSNIG